MSELRQVTWFKRGKTHMHSNINMENQKLPNATAVLILGIFSILTCCCYGIISIILGAIGLVLANKDAKLYAENPSAYTNYNNLKIGVTPLLTIDFDL